MSIESNEIIEYEELIDMYDEIKEMLIDRPDLLHVFHRLLERGDMNYSPPSSDETSDDDSEGSLVPEDLESEIDSEGFYNLT